MVPNLDFLAALEIERNNKLVENFILQHLQLDIDAENLVEFLEAAFANIGFTITTVASHEQTKPPFIFVSPIITYLDSAAISPSSSHLFSPPHTPPYTARTSATPTPPTTPRPNPPKAMAARFAPLALPQVFNDMPADYQSKIPLFDGTPQNIIAQ